MGKVIPVIGGGGADLDVITAGAGDVLNGKVIVDQEGNPLTGTMPNRGNVSQALGAGGSYTIPAGYHAGGGKVTANSLASQTSANASAGHILSGQTAWVNGSKITGNMPNRGAVSQSLGINGSYTIPAGYHNGSGKVTQSIATMGGQTITPSVTQQTVSCSGKYMTGNVIVNPCCRVYSYDSTVNVLGENQTSSIKNISIPVNVLNGEYVFLSLYVSSLGFPRGSSDSFKINQKNPTIYTYSNQVQVYFQISADGKYITGTTLTPTSGASSSGLNRNSEICIRVTVLPYLLLYK